MPYTKAMWQPKTFQHIQRVLGDQPGVRDVRALGSLAAADLDEWSDLDVGVLVDAAAFDRFSPTLDWARQFGDLYASSQSVAAHKGTTRLVFADGSRVDFSIATTPAALQAAAPPPDSRGQAESLALMANDFKFEAILAIAKLARHDLLIGVHLLLGLERHCLVLAMMLRDRQLSTTHHRQGGAYNEVAGQLGGPGATLPELLERLRQATTVFARLAGQLDPDQPQDWAPIERALAQARRAI